jgi:RNA polymerase sigma-70 factor (ECF subfamily)
MAGDDKQEAGLDPDRRVRDLLDAGRDREAANLLITLFSPELRPFLFRLLGDSTLAEEAHSETCERLWRGLPGFRWECSLRSWSYIIARREASRCRGRRARALVMHTTLSAGERVPATATLPSLSTTRRDRLESLRASLSDEDRDLLVLRVERGLAWKDIAAAFAEDDSADAAVLERESARLRQRFRSIRTTLATALSKRQASKGTER